MAYLDDTGLAYFWGKIKAWAQGLFALIGHTHPSSDVTLMTGYSMPSSSSAISASDTLNQAVGKLEKGASDFDAGAVHKAGTETVTGEKTFRNAFDRASRICGLIFRNQNAARGTTPSEDLLWTFPFADSSGAEWDSSGAHGRIGLLECSLRSSGGASLSDLALRVYKNEAGSLDNVTLAIGYDAEGVKFAQAPSTSASRVSGTDIVTRDWLGNDAANLVHRSGEERVSGLKIFDRGIVLRNSAVSAKGTNPSAETAWYMTFLANTGGSSPSSATNGVLGRVVHTLYADGTSSLMLTAFKNEAGSGLGASLQAVCTASGVTYAMAPSTRSDRSNGTDIVTRDWLSNDAANLVHRSGDETVAGAKTLTSNQGLSLLRILDRNQTLSSPAVLYGVQLNGKNSLSQHNLLLMFFERNPSDYTFGSSRYINRSVLRVYGATGKVADLGVYMDDSNNVRVSVPTSSGANFDGYVGKNILYVGADAVADSTLALRGDDPAKQRCGVVRFGNYNGYNTAHIGASNESNSAPQGLLITNTNGTVTGEFYGHYRPAVTGTYNLGASSLRWANLYISASAVSTSDEREKTSVSGVPDAVLDAWAGVDFVQFKFRDAVAEKGVVRARLHSGLVAQRVAEAFSSRGLDASAYGLFCYDEWDAEPEVLDQNGEQARPGREAGNLYSLRYEEALCMEAAYQRRRADRAEARIAALEDRLAALELRLGSE